MTLALLAAGFYSVYRRSTATCKTGNCGTDGDCGTPLAERVIKIALWSAAAVVALVLAWPYLAPHRFG